MNCSTKDLTSNECFELAIISRAPSTGSLNFQPVPPQRESSSLTFKRSPSQITELLRSGGGIRGVKLILCVALFTVAAVAQSSTSYRIDTFAGTRAVRDNGPAVNARLWEPQGVAVDGAGNLFFADSFNDRIRKVDSTGTITTIAGTGEYGFGGDGGPAVNARLSRPSGVAVDGAGNLFIADMDNNRIRKVDSAGIITTVAGTAARRSTLGYPAPVVWRWTGRAMSSSLIVSTTGSARSMHRGRSALWRERDGTASAAGTAARRSAPG